MNWQPVALGLLTLLSRGGGGIAEGSEETGPTSLAGRERGYIKMKLLHSLDIDLGLVFTGAIHKTRKTSSDPSDS